MKSTGYRETRPYNDGVSIHIVKEIDGRNKSVTHYLSGDEARELRDDLNEVLDEDTYE